MVCQVSYGWGVSSGGLGEGVDVRDGGVEGYGMLRPAMNEE